MHILAGVVIVLFLLSILFEVSIFITNNCIADSIEKALVKYELPTDTVLVDSTSIAGRVMGNGNGMMYLGSILVKTDLSKEELQEYYSRDFDIVEIRRQNSESMPENADCYNFEYFSDMEVNTYYSINCWDSKRNEKFGDFISDLLDLDIRGH